jgi:hypothetical protein
MPWGKYRGRLLSEVPSGYLAWCLEECENVKPSLREAIRSELADRLGLGYGGEAVRPPAPDFGPGVEQLYRQLVMRWHPDRGGSTEAMQAVNDFYDGLRALAGASDVMKRGRRAG